MRKQVEAVPESASQRMKNAVQRIMLYLEDSCMQGFPMTTSCSGTDLICPVVQLLFQVISLVLDVPQVAISHLWSCESEGYKALWISEVIGAPTVFRDVADLPRRFAAIHEASKKVGFPDVQAMSCGLLHACGFSCKSVSMYNNKRNRFLRCIRQRRGTTGSLFWHTLRFVKRYLPIFILLENVAGFRADNLEMCLECLRLVGYVCITMILDLHEHGIPCKRSRRWILCQLRPTATVAEQAQLQREASQLESAMRQCPGPLSDYLSTSMDDAHRGYKRKRIIGKRKVAEGKTSSSKKRRTGKPAKYEDLHDKVWDGKRPATISKPLHAICGELTPRELDIAMYDVEVKAPEDEAPASGSHRIIDVSQSITRYPSGWDVCPTVTPGARFLVRQGNADVRLLRGFECLRMQGLPFDLITTEGMTASSKFTQKQLMSLAGNAFSAPHVSVAMVLMLCVFDMPASVADVEALRTEAFVFVFK